MPDTSQMGEVQPVSRAGVIAAIAVLLVVLVAAGLGYQAFIGTGSSSGAQQASAEGTSADALMLSDFDCEVQTAEGASISLTQIADGKPLVVNFWATWCPYCIEEMPDFQEIYDEYGDRVSFAFVDATDGTRETVDDGKAWVADAGYTLPFYYDVARQGVRTFGIQSYPTTIVVSAEGEILTISPGKIDKALMKSALDSLLQ